MKRESKPKLKPCPFCGKTDHIEPSRPCYSYTITCYNCGAEGPLGKTPAAAVKVWNRRTSDAD